MFLIDCLLSDFGIPFDTRSKSTVGVSCPCLSTANYYFSVLSYLGDEHVDLMTLLLACWIAKV